MWPHLRRPGHCEDSAQNRSRGGLPPPSADAPGGPGTSPSPAGGVRFTQGRRLSDQHVLPCTVSLSQVCALDIDKQ